MAINTISLTNYLPHVATQVPPLPAELWLRILSHLPKFKLDRMSLVSHQIRDVMKSPVGLAQLMDNVYKYLRVSKRIEALLKCGPFLREMNAAFNNGILTPPILEELATKCKGVTSLHFNLFDKTLDVNPLLALPHLAKLDLTIGLEQPCDAVTLKLGLGLKELILNNSHGLYGPGFYLESIISQINALTKLEKLVIDDLNSNYVGCSYTFPTSLRELSLYPNFLGNFKDAMQGNTSLVSLSLIGFTNLKENELDYIARCTHLTSLQIAEAKDFPHYTSLINLKSLWLDRLHPHSFSVLSTFTQLEELIVTCVGEECFPFETLPSLKKLRVSCRSNSLMQSLCHLSQLTSLDFLCRNEGDYKFLTALTQLEQMSLYDQTDKNLRAIGLITSLKELYLRVSDYAHDTIPCLTSLTSLDIGSCNTAQLVALTSLSNLVQLRVQGSSILDIKPLRQCHSLRDLTVNHWDGPGPSPLMEVKGLTQLESIYFYSFGPDNVNDPRFHD